MREVWTQKDALEAALSLCEDEYQRELVLNKASFGNEDAWWHNGTTAQRKRYSARTGVRRQLMLRLQQAGIPFRLERIFIRHGIYIKFGGKLCIWCGSYSLPEASKQIMCIKCEIDG